MPNTRETEPTQEELEEQEKMLEEQEELKKQDELEQEIWFEKIESVFQISKCIDKDKVKYAIYTLEGRALTWWNCHVHTLGIDATDRISWDNLKTMMTIEYYPRTKIQKIEQELWNLTMKGDDIDGYTNFHGNITSSKPATIHEAVIMARGLVDQAVRAKATRISDSNKRKWEEQQRGNNNNNYRNNTHHHQQNQRHEVAKAYVAALAEGKVYLRNLPLCNRCKLHHHCQCTVKCRKCKGICHQTKDCWNKTPTADTLPTADANA
ncbi:putative reverse transcriptase domain-containing protein [Tanacetum coccineum]